LKIFRKSVNRIQVSLKSDKNSGYFIDDQRTFFITSRPVLLSTRDVPYKSCRENQNTHFVLCNPFPKIVPFMRLCWKIRHSRAGHIWQYGSCALHTVYLRLQTHIPNMSYFLLFHGNNGYANAP